MDEYKNEQAQDLEEQEELNEEIEQDESPDYEALYREEKSKNNKLKRKLFSKDKDADKPKINNRSDDSWKARMELKVEGYSEEETDFIIKNGGKKALDNQYITSAIETMRERKKAEAAMVDVSSKSESEKRYSPEEFSKLSTEEQLKVLQSIK